MKIYRNLVKEGHPLELEEDIVFSREECQNDYPLLSIPSCHAKLLIENVDDFLTCDYSLVGEMELSDSRTAKPFLLKFEDSDLIDLLQNEEEEGEGYIFPGTFIQSEELIHKIIRTLVPISPHQEDSPLPESGEGYSFVEEKESFIEEGEPEIEDEETPSETKEEDK